ncbi:LysE family translocator [Pseudomonas sp. LA5]|uniref:LysE family translocator n=1 Tax=Pseudomonas sp. LA5 TaxID=3027850 RepID=UPI002361F34F|nr:LysE family transporter [Pseudomonas sp. LA5]
MYSPGPVNALGLNAGLRGQARRALGFYAGVGCAMLLLFLALGYAGAVLVSGALLPWLALLGGGYCLYLGYLIARAAPPTAAGEEEGAATRLTFARGFLIQGLNPKGWPPPSPVRCRSPSRCCSACADCSRHSSWTPPSAVCVIRR